MPKEYIEREAAIAFVKNNTPTLDKMTTIGCVERALYNAPAADVVEVVRCKSCKHRITDTFGRTMCSRSFTWIEVNLNDFCSHGERKDGAE
jgi:hypothetical protein